MDLFSYTRLERPDSHLLSSIKVLHVQEPTSDDETRHRAQAPAAPSTSLTTQSPYAQLGDHPAPSVPPSHTH